MSEKTFTLAEAHKYFGIELNQLIWALLSKQKRSPDEDELMIHSAHASHFHWLKAGSKVNEQRGEWIISRVYSVLNIPERALFHAKRCKKITEDYSDEMKDFDLAYADEVIARALACNGNFEECKKNFESAKEKGDKIDNMEEKEIFIGDLNSEPWYGAV